MIKISRYLPLSNNLAKAYFSYVFNKKNLNYLPLKLWIETTSRCNLSCKLCANKNLNQSQKGDMQFWLFKKIIDEAKDFVFQANLFHRGEPLLHPEITQMISYAKQNGILTCIHTNATLLDENISEKLILSGLDKIFFSFDSYNKNDYEKNRKGSDYDKTLSNIINFLQIKKKLKAKKPAAILLLMDLAILNKDSKNLNSKYKKTKIFNSIKRNINANISADRNINIDSNICSNIDSNINNIDRNIDNNININIEANIDSNIYKNNKFEFLKNFKGLPLDKIIFRKPHNWAGNLNLPLNTKPVNIMKCTFLWYSLTILFNGDVVLCPQDFQGKLLVGNLKTQSIREVFNNNTMQNFREKFSKKNIKCLIPCNNCDRILRKTFASIPLEFLKNKRI